MLSFGIIIFVIALALAPLMHFLPSKRQRRIVRIREYAALNGLFVEFRDMPVNAGRQMYPAPSSLDLIYYGKRFHAKRGVLVQPGVWIRADEGWRSVGSRLSVPSEFEQFPPSVLCATVDNFSCGVYWNESSEEQGIEHIREALQQWSDTLMC
jgi:hypothetical protein